MTTGANIQDTRILTYRSYNPFTDFDTVKNIWLTLLDKCHHSYFVSWGWISTWINSLPKDLDIQLITGYINNEPVVAFFVGRTKRNNHRFVPTKTISLNSTANRYYDELTIEYNSILFDPTHQLSTENLFGYLNSITWDEFRMPGISANFLSDFNLVDNASHSFHTIVDGITNSFFVELQKIRDAGMNYLQLLSANKRSQIRRSIKQYEIEGTIQIHEATGLEEALTMLDQLASLHQQEWTKRGKPGSFSNKYFYQFHRELIQNQFNSNEIQLLHIFNDKRTIGYLYNFIYDNNVLFYQSGLNYSAENTYRPGLVSHYFAIMHNAKKGLLKYDFLAGDAAYKNSLSTSSTPMYWIRFIKSRSRFNFEKAMAFAHEWLVKRGITV